LFRQNAQQKKEKKRERSYIREAPERASGKEEERKDRTTAVWDGKGSPTKKTRLAVKKREEYLRSQGVLKGGKKRKVERRGGKKKRANKADRKEGKVWDGRQNPHKSL